MSSLPVPDADALPPAGATAASWAATPPAAAPTTADLTGPNPALALALAVDLANIAVWSHDLRSNRVHCSERANDVLCVKPRAEGVPLEELRALIHPDDVARVRLAAARALHSTGPVDIEARYRDRDGQWRHVLTRRVLQRDAAGHPQAFIGVAMDVTARHEQERQTQEIARRLEMATAAAGIGYWSRAVDEERPQWSPAMYALCGLLPGVPAPTSQEWLARFVHPDDAEELRSRYGAWHASGQDTLSHHLRLCRPDGSVRHVATHSRVERSGAKPLMFGVVIDLTERRSAELALRNAQERAAMAALGAGLGTWEVDPQTGDSFWDAQMWRLRGRAPAGRAMSHDERMACVHPEDREMLARRLQAALRDGGPLETEFRVIWPDGQVRWLASRSGEVRDETSGTRRRIGVNWDVTDRRTADGVRQEREMALHESQAKSRFLARMSHELRTPLNAVLGFSQLLLAEAPGVDPAALTRRRQLEHIQTAGQHLLALIDDVLDLSSLQSGELRVSLQPVALAPLVQQTLPMLEALRSHHGVSLQLGDLSGAVLADALRLRQVLLNLLSNAIKYNRPGGEVRLEALAAGGQRLLRVRDNGQGMDAEQLRHLFEPFNRLGRHSEGPAGVEGSGIGLAIVKALMERMGGRVEVSSTPGVGSCFDLYLADAPAPADTDAQSAPATAAPRGTLLYVEDNAVNALIVSELISRRPDLQLHVATTGATGVQCALALQPDLVLLDMQLPDCDGHEVLRRMRAHPQLAAVPVIALSANAMPEDIERALRAGMSDYWTKPLDFTAFMASLDKLFGPSAA